MQHDFKGVPKTFDAIFATPCQVHIILAGGMTGACCWKIIDKIRCDQAHLGEVFGGNISR
jgi:hypothetical protein